MTTGVLLFAHNNKHIDYVELAAWSADRIHRHLKLPVCLVTDSATTDPVFDCVVRVDEPESNDRYFEDLAQNVAWKNTNRSCAFELSPYDATLVLDVDYVVASADLLTVFDSPQDFLTPSRAYDVTGINTFEDLNNFGKFCMPMVWATVMFFRKTPTAQLMFDTVKMIKNNWTHYRDLYQMGRTVFRNDFAFAIAANLIHGQTARWPHWPTALPSVLPAHVVKQLSADVFSVHYRDAGGKSRYIELDSQDFHAMGKRSLGDIVAGT